MQRNCFRLRKFAAAAVVLLPTAAFGAAAISESSPYNGITLYDVVDYVTDNADKSGGTFGAGRQIHYQIAAIDLKTAGLSFSLTPNNGSAPDQTNTQTTKSYLTQTGAAVAINANYFDFNGNPTTTLDQLETSAGTDTAPWGAKSGGSVAGINISASNKVTFIQPADRTNGGYGTNKLGTTTAVSLYNAIGSNYMSVKNNALTGVVNDGDDYARASIGIKGNTLYLFTDTDLNEGDGLGLLPTEVGQILHDQWGLTNVLNLDGGGSTQMAIRTSRGVTYANTPASADAPRLVGSNLAVYAADAASTFNKLDDFETTDASSGLAVSGTGHFYGTPEDSGSNVNVKSNSTAVLDTSTAHSGSSSMQLNINDSSATAGFQERFLSSSAHAYTNVRFASSGYFGLWIKTSTPNVTVSPVIDDDFDGNDLVEGMFRSLTADGQWHLYQWNMADNAQWQNFYNDSDGHITSPGVSLNSIWFDSSTAENAVINFDDVGWTESGAIPVPEPVGTTALLAATLLVTRRRRSSARIKRQVEIL